MSEAIYFPTIDKDTLHTLRLLKSAVEQDPDLTSSTYPVETAALITAMFQLAPPLDMSYLELPALGKAEFTEKEAVELYQKLRNLELSATTHLEGTEILQSIKTRFSLLDKLTTLQEKATNMKSMIQFEEEVMLLLETVLTKKQLAAFLIKLETIQGK